MIFRFISGVVIGVPVAFIAYYLLPLIIADIEIRHIAYVGLSAAFFGILYPAILVKWIAFGLMWKRV